MNANPIIGVKASPVPQFLCTQAMVLLSQTLIVRFFILPFSSTQARGSDQGVGVLKSGGTHKEKQSNINFPQAHEGHVDTSY